jgi:transcription termination factor Rho
VTDTQDQLDVLSSADASSTGASLTQPTGSVARAKRRSGSLSAMLLPELQALATSMGIPTGKLRKSDLIAAIEGSNLGSSEGRSARPSAAKTPRTAAQTPSADDGAAPGTPPAATAADAAVETKPRTRRGASRPAGPAQPTLTDGEPAASAESAAPQTNDQAAVAAPEQVERTREPRESSGGRASREPGSRNRDNQRETQRDNQRDGGQNRDTQRDGGQNRDTQRETQRDNQRDGGQNRDTQRDGGQNRDSQRDNQRDGGQNRETQRDNQRDGGQNRETQRDNQRETQRDGGQNRDGGGNNRNQSQNRDSNRGDEDDEFSGGRRGRRYRDRRGRNRDRFDGNAAGNGRNDAEPAISEDDVLVPVAGILDAVEDKNTWFIRTAGYFASPDDVYVANSHVRRFGLRRGDAVTGVVRQPRDGERKEKFNPLVRLDTVNGVDPEQAKNRVEFTKLTPLYPQDRLRLETEPHILTTRVIDLVMPIGKGQRALIVSPPKAGKTSVLQAIANAIAVNNPECHLMVVLVDERPEEVTDMQRSVKGEVIASTFDRRPQDHTMIAELSIERAKRLVEMGHDVVVLLDSITRLGRAYNLAAPASGRILSGGVDSTALYPPKRFLGAARNIEDGGSLTILATALVETGSTMDTVIFEEFKGTGNAELILDRKIADKRVFPAVNVDTSGTRKEEILMSPDELAVVLKLRRVLHALDPQQGIDLLLDRLKKSRTNIEFLMQIAKTAPGSDDR